MNRTIITLLAICISFQLSAQFISSFHPQQEPADNMQYYKPAGNLFVGDCIPFYHDGTYYLYWLLDSGHHSALGGLGGHQWALSTTKDLKHWQHHGVVLGIDESWEKSICTGSVVWFNKKFYAFYATRLIDSAGKVNEQLSYSVSDDGIHFQKQKPNPFYTSAPGYSKRNFRDPKVIVDSAGVFHLFVSSETDGGKQYDKGALVHLVSRDLKKWDVLQPVIYGQLDVPECPDYFNWNGWYYIIYGRGGNTFYMKSKKPYGEWEYPKYQALNEDWVNVAKTAQFTNGRRIVAGWIPSKKDAKDGGYEIFGGNIVLRELYQEADGTLYTGFPPETQVPTANAIGYNISSDSMIDKKGHGSFVITSQGGMHSAFIESVPANCVVTFDAEPQTALEDYGIYLRASSNNEGYRLELNPQDKTVSLAGSIIRAVSGLDKKVNIRIVMKDDIIDVCIGGKRCIVNRLYERKGNTLAFFVKHGKAAFNNVIITPL